MSDKNEFWYWDDGIGDYVTTKNIRVIMAEYGDMNNYPMAPPYDEAHPEPHHTYEEEWYDEQWSAYEEKMERNRKR